MNIEIEPDLAAKPISAREKIAVYILLMIFSFIVPAKYSHQVDKVVLEVKALLTA